MKEYTHCNRIKPVIAEKNKTANWRSEQWVVTWELFHDR